jgi:copper transport protein
MTRWMKPRACGVLIVFITVVLAVAVGVRSASAHAALESSDPPANAVLDAAPAQITLHFTEPLEPAQTGADLLNPAGEVIPDATSAVDQSDPFALQVQVPADLAAGTYVVSWHNVSTADGHPMEGFFAFSIESATDPSGIVSGIEQQSGGPPYWWITVVKWAGYLGLALLVAAWPIWLFVVRPAISSVDSLRQIARRRARGLLMAGWALFAVGSIGALLNQAWLSEPERGVLNRTWNVITDTRYGTIWLYRMAALVIFGTLSLLAIRYRSRALELIAASSAFAIPLSLSEIAHASAQTTGRGAAITADWIHLSAAMLWTGGLVYVIASGLQARRNNRQTLAVLVPRFSVIAIACWLVLTLTGVYSAWLLVGGKDAATDTAHGKALIAKLMLLAAALVFAAANLLILSPRLSTTLPRTTNWLSGSVVIETLLVITALLAVGRMVGLQPARDALGQAQPPGIAQTLDASEHALTLSISPGRPGINTYTLSGSDIPSDATVEGLLRLTRPDAVAADKEIKLARQPDGSFSGSGAELSLVGEWGIEAIVRQIGSFQWSALTTVPITQAPAAPSGAQVTGWRFDTTGAIGMLAVALAIGLAAAAWLVQRERRLSLLSASSGVLLVGILAMVFGRI